MPDRPLRILQLFNRYLQPGGEERSVARIAADLETGGHEVQRFWRASEEWRRPGAPARWRQPLLLLRNPPVLAELAELHRRVRPDLWLAHNVNPVISLGVFGLARRLGAPLLQYLHNYRPVSPGGALMAGRRPLAPEDRWIALREAWAGSWNGRLATALLAAGYWRLRRNGDFDHVAAWIAISGEMRRQFVRARWYPERLHVLPHSWHVAPAPEKPRDDGHFLFLGRLVEEKGVRFLVTLWQRPELRPHRLVLAGDGPLAAELRAQAPPNVEWAGFVGGDRKRELLQGCRAVLFPCLWPEPLGMVVHEAYEAGKPVLASDTGGLKETVADQVTGRLLPVADSGAWLDAIISLTPEAAGRLGGEGRRWLATHASPAAWNRGFQRIAAAALSRAG